MHFRYIFADIFFGNGGCDQSRLKCGVARIAIYAIFWLIAHILTFCDKTVVFNCFPTNYKRVAQFGELNKGHNLNKGELDQDEKVEIILASTALVAVIALFLR